MKVGISTASLFMRLNTEDALPLFSEWNVPEAEVFLTSFSEYEPAFAKKVAESRGNVKVHSVHVLNTQFEPQLYNAHPRVSADAFAWLKKAMTSAQLLGASKYTFHGIARIKRTYREDLKSLGENTEKIARVCKEYSVTLCLENVEWALYNRTGIFTEMKKYCPELKGVLDLKQARITGEPYEAYLKEMGESLSHVHVCDFTADGNTCVAGAGTFDFDGLFARLKDAGFCGTLLIENYCKDYKNLGQLKRAYEFLAEKAYKYTCP